MANHLSVVRSWMQRRFLNGEQVTWGSEEVLRGPIGGGLTVREIEELAEDIRNVVLQNFEEAVKEFYNDFGKKEN